MILKNRGIYRINIFAEAHFKNGFSEKFPAPTEGIHHIEPDTKVYFDKECLGKGTVHISENVLCWISSTGSGFSIQYRSITVHAVSMDKANFPEPCIFLMTDGKIKLEDLSSSETVQLEGAMNSMNVNESDGDGDVIDDEEMDPNLLYLVPDNKNSLDAMFKAITICQNLNPEESLEDDEDDDDGFDNLSFDIQVTNGELEDFENGDEEFSDMDEGQFEDAE